MTFAALNINMADLIKFIRSAPQFISFNGRRLKASAAANDGSK